MAQTYKSNIQAIVNALERKQSGTMDIIEKGMRKAVRGFESRMIIEQLSGRKGNKGLYRQSGNLADSWTVDSKRANRNVIATFSTSAKYAKIHQFGGTIVPKRLYILEDWKRRGGKLILKTVANDLRNFYRG